MSAFCPHDIRPAAACAWCHPRPGVDPTAYPTGPSVLPAAELSARIAARRTAVDRLAAVELDAVDISVEGTTPGGQVLTGTTRVTERGWRG